MITFLREYDVAGLWMIHLVSFVVALILRSKKSIKAYDEQERRLTSIGKFSIIFVPVAFVFILVDQLILRRWLQYYFLGSFTDWIIYCVLFMLLDLTLIGIYPNNKNRKDNQYENFNKLAIIYRIFRSVYIALIVLRFVAGVLLAGPFTRFIGFPVGDYRRGNETETFEGLIFELKTFGEGFARQDLVIYRKKAFIFKKKIYEIKDIGINAVPDVDEIAFNHISEDTILFYSVVPNILIRQQDGFLLTNKDERQNMHTAYFAGSTWVDTTINIRLKK